MLIRQGSWDDFPRVHDVHLQTSRATAEPQFTLEQLREYWTRPSFDPARDLWVAEHGDGPLVGFAHLHADQAMHVRARPGSDGVHAALLAVVEKAARDRGYEWVAATVTDADADACRAFEAAGYVVQREVWRMWVGHEEEPPPASFGPGIAVRTYEAADADAVHALLDHAYCGWDEAYVPLAHDDWLAFMTGSESFDPECWFLAEADGGLAGVCLNWKEGWVKDLAVRPSWRRQGLGEALLRHTFHELHRRGVSRIGLKVDADNSTGAPRLYERLGFVTDRRYPTYSRRL
ncbi:MAG: GNAT family N-acetyltransferase [Gaiellaceae bacterium]